MVEGGPFLSDTEGIGAHGKGDPERVESELWRAAGSVAAMMGPPADLQEGA